MLNKTVLEKFLIAEQTGENDLFLTYNGKDTQTGLAVNITALKPNMVIAVNFLQRFESLAKAIAKIDSPHTVPVLDYGDVDGQAVVVREGIEGQSLTNLVTGGNGLQLDIALDIARQLGEYAEAIHQAGVFQVVFDPEEILLSSDSVVRVTNLGMAQGLNIGELLAKGKAKAQPYHAPELLRGEKTDPRTDFYSLGALLFEILTGKELDAKAVASDQSLIADRLPSRQRLGIPPEWDELVAKCLQPNPAKRIQSAAEFMNRVTEVKRGMAEGAQATIIGMEDSLMGQTLGAYRLVERLGQGGMATVYKGYEAALDRYVAVKVLPQFFASDPNFTQRFRREAKAVAQLNHPNIIPIYSYGEESGITYLVMQFVEGGTLKHERGQTHSPEEALRLLLPIARALGYAHGRGIVHRDIKPSNVLMAEGNWPMLADFGLAQMAESSMRLTGTGVGLGTPMYMSPEQGRGDQVDARTDIYSLGIMLYELVTGDVPFRADTPMAIVIKHMTAPMPMPRQLNPNIPAEVENIILKSTAKDSDDRYQTVGEMVTAMERVLNRLAAAIKEEEVVEELRTKKIKPGHMPPLKQPGAKKVPKTALIVILSLIGLCFLGVILMGVFDICPPAGPWPQPPWCPGSPYKLPTFGGESATSVPTPMITEGTLGSVLFQDDFDGEPSMRWDFQPRRWETTTMDGRTVLLSDTSESTAFVGLKSDGWTDYAVQFDFKFLKPDEHNAYYFYLRFRATDCPPTVKAVDNYVALITTDVVILRDESCETQMQEQVAQSDRNISGEDWHTAQVIAVGNRLRLLIDGEQYFDYTDSESPHLDGGVTLDLENNVGLAIDNFRVNEIIPGEAAITSTPIPYITEGELGQVLFEDDFEDGVSPAWFELQSTWQADFVDGRGVLRGAGQHDGDFAFITNEDWADFTIQTEFNFIGVSLSNNYDISISARMKNCPPETQWLSTYNIFVTYSVINFSKTTCDTPREWAVLQSAEHTTAPREWHALQVTVVGNRTQVFLDGEQYIDYLDTASPILAGGAALGTVDGTEALFDNVRVTEIIPTAAPAPEDCRKVFVNYQGNYNVHVRNCDDSGVQRVTDLITDVSAPEHPVWSPDEQYILFVSRHEGQRLNSSGEPEGSLYTIRPDGTGLTRLTRNASDDQPAWSPDGKQIVFHRNCSLAVINADGTGAAIIARPYEDLFCIDQSAWSPDGKRIAFTSLKWPSLGFLTEQAVFVVNPDGSNLTQLAAVPAENWVEYNVVWSPDGAQVAFSVAGRKYIVSADGSGEPQETDSIPDSWYPWYWPQWGGEAQAATPTSGSMAEQVSAFADPILAAISSRTPTYEDNFDDPESGWKTGLSGSGEVGYVPAVGEYFAAVPAANGGDHVCADADDGRIPVPYAADFVMEYRFRFAVVAEGGKLIVHFRTIGGVYSMWVDISTDPDAQITLLDELTKDVAGPKFGSYRLGGGIMSGEWFTVRIIARGAAIVVYVDDRPAIFAQIPNYDPAMHGSEIGFNFCNQGQSPIEGRWDYLRLWDIGDIP